MQSTVAGLAPFPQARFAAITQLAVFEAVNAINKEYRPYLGTVTAPETHGRSGSNSGCAHQCLRRTFPTIAATLDAARASSLAIIPDGPAKTPGSPRVKWQPRR